MATIGPKEAQRRAMREVGRVRGAVTIEQVAELIARPIIVSAGMSPDEEPKKRFDRIAYQRAYMREWRKRKKAAK